MKTPVPEMEVKEGKTNDKTEIKSKDVRVQPFANRERSLSPKKQVTFDLSNQRGRSESPKKHVSFQDETLSKVQTCDQFEGTKQDELMKTQHEKQMRKKQKIKTKEINSPRVSTIKFLFKKYFTETLNYDFI